MLTMCAQLWISKFQYLHLKVGNLSPFLSFHLHQPLLTCSLRGLPAVCFLLRFIDVCALLHDIIYT